MNDYPFIAAIANQILSDFVKTAEEQEPRPYDWADDPSYARHHFWRKR